VAYVRNARPGTWRAHGAYLAREGAQRPNEPGRGFDLSRDDIDIAATIGAWQNAGDERLWKAIVSPEQAERLDLRAHARSLVTRMERDLGTGLEWVAIEHHDTDNPHLHLLIRGRDDRGRPLTIDPAYIQRGIRDRSEELATDVLGLRTDREILAGRTQAVERVQFTELDRRILRTADSRGHVRYAGPPPTDRTRRAQRMLEMRRLDFLVTLGLAERVGPAAWHVSGDLERTLRQAQLAGDILKSRARHQAHVSDPRIPLVVTRLAPGMRLAGRVVGTGLADELHDRRYLLLEGTDRRLHYIVLTPGLEAGRRPLAFRTGDRVVLSGRSIERGGHTVDMHVEPTKAEPTDRSGDRSRAIPARGALPRLRDVQRTLGRSVTTVPPSEGLIYRGRLVGYARGEDGQRYAVVDTGRELAAFRTAEAEITAGREIRAMAQHTDDDRRRRLIWRLGDDERERHRERSQ